LEEEKDKNQKVAVDNFNSTSSEEEESFTNKEYQPELVFQALQKKKMLRNKILKIIGIIALLLIIITAASAVYSRNKQAKTNAEAINQVAVEIPAGQDHAFVGDSTANTQQDSVKTVAAVVSAEDKGVAGKSENYQIKNISIGGSSVILASEDENLELKITEVHSETLLSKDGKKTEMLLSWKTNKLGKSEVKYSKNGADGERSIKEDGYGFSHALILSSLEQSTRYLFTVNAIDRSGNGATSDTLAIFTGTKPVSVFDLISNQMADIFGWALK
jgi:hypothetical protein